MGRRRRKEERGRSVSNDLKASTAWGVVSICVAAAHRKKTISDAYIRQTDEAERNCTLIRMPGLSKYF